MMQTWTLNLRLFEGGGAAGGAGDGGAGTSAEGSAGGQQTLEDGTRMDSRLAERMERQRKRHPGRTAGAATPAEGQGNTQQTADAAAQALQQNRSGAEGNTETGENNPAQTQKTPEEEFDELIRGKYAKQYQQRFQQGISDRFKNQADLQGQLDGLKPMLDTLAAKYGTAAGDYNALSAKILDDDSLYEEEAEAAGMTVEAYKNFQRMKAAADKAAAREQEAQEQAQFRAHLQKLVQQGEELKKVYPDFDLMTELGNEKFRRMTGPNGGLTVEQAYHAIHYRELMPQVAQAGIQRAQTQISQSLQANAARPVEGAMQGNTAAADIHIDPRSMTRQQREAIKDRVRRGEKIVL